jgi:hypothetical protein
LVYVVGILISRSNYDNKETYKVYKDGPDKGRCIVVCSEKDNTKSLPENGRFFYVLIKNHS